MFHESNPIGLIVVLGLLFVQSHHGKWEISPQASPSLAPADGRRAVRSNHLTFPP